MEREPETIDNFSHNDIEEMLAEEKAKKDAELKASALQAKETSKKIFFVGIAIALLFLIAYAIVRIVPFVISSLAGAGSGLTSVFSSREEIVVTISPSTVSNGEEFTLSWKHSSPKTTGAYNFTYTCGSKFYIEHTYPNGRTEQVVCDSPFVLPTQETSLGFKAFLTEANSYADIPLFINYVEEGSNEAEITGKATLTVRNGEAVAEEEPAPEPEPAATTTKPKPTTTTTAPRSYIGTWGGLKTPTKPTSTNGSTITGNQPQSLVKPDLIATNAQVGTINPQTNIFTPQSSVTPGTRVAIQFEVVNAGGQATGNWKLSATLPTATAETLESQTQTSLRGGDKMIFTLSFDNLSYKADNAVVIRLDPTNKIAESNENNNTLFISVKQDVISKSNKPDLTVQILDTGTMGSTVSSYDAKNTIPNGRKAGIRFVVENKGGQATSNWKFKIDLPNDQTFNSSSQQGLGSGESREFIIGFDNLPEDETSTIEVIVDSADSVNESDENNNDDSVRIKTT